MQGQRRCAQVKWQLAWGSVTSGTGASMTRTSCTTAGEQRLCVCAFAGWMRLEQSAVIDEQTAPKALGLVPSRMARIPHQPSPPWCQTTAPSSSGGSHPSFPGSWRLAPLQPNSEMEGHAALRCRPAAACVGNASGGGGGGGARWSVLPQEGSSAALLESSPASSASSSCPRQSSSVCDWRVPGHLCRAAAWRSLGSSSFLCWDLLDLGRREV